MEADALITVSEGNKGSSRRQKIGRDRDNRKRFGTVILLFSHMVLSRNGLRCEIIGHTVPKIKVTVPFNVEL